MKRLVPMTGPSSCRSLSAALALVLVALCGLLFPMPSVQSRESSSHIWHLKQKHVDKGEFDLYIASDRVKVVSPQGYKFIVAAPDWTVHCFRDESKLQYMSSLSEFSGLQMGNPMIGAWLSKSRLIPSGRGAVQGLSYTSYTTRKPSSTILAGSGQIVADPHVVEFIARFYHSPDTGTVPLFYYSVHKKKSLPDAKQSTIQLGPDIGVDYRAGLIKEIVLLSWRKEPYRAAEFARPVNYARTKEMTQVIFTSAQKDELAELVGGIGYRSEKTRKMENAGPAGKRQNSGGLPGRN